MCTSLFSTILDKAIEVNKQILENIFPLFVKTKQGLYIRVFDLLSLVHARKESTAISCDASAADSLLRAVNNCDSVFDESSWI